MPSGVAARQAELPLQRAQMRSPNPSLQKAALHLRQARSAATSLRGLTLALTALPLSVIM
jgi:hypothetical protein